MSERFGNGCVVEMRSVIEMAQWESGGDRRGTCVYTVGVFYHHQGYRVQKILSDMQLIYVQLTSSKNHSLPITIPYFVESGHPAELWEMTPTRLQLLKFLWVNKDFLTGLLIGGQQAANQSEARFENSCYANMNSNMTFLVTQALDYIRDI